MTSSVEILNHQLSTPVYGSNGSTNQANSGGDSEREPLLTSKPGVRRIPVNKLLCAVATVAVVVVLLVLVPYITRKSDNSTALDSHTSWGYNEKNGPNSKNPNWQGLCRNGTSQSPINIVPSSVIKDQSLTSLNFSGYDRPGIVTITNNGHSVTATGFNKWGDGKLTPFISGGGLKGKYNLVDFHLHWGENNASGSEHQLNFTSFPLEAHFVHQRADLTSEQALLVPDGMAVVAVWFTLDNNNPTPLKQLDTAYANITLFNSSVTLSVTLSNMLPKNVADYYRYSGSLTTPHCNETVIWTIMNEKMTVADYQLKQLREHLDESNEKLTHNYRGLQKLNDRVVSRSFQ